MFQTFNWTALTLALLTHAAAGLVTRAVLGLTLMALPATVIGAWIGVRLYRRLSDLHFDRIVHGLLIASGLSLVASQLGAIVKH